MTGKKGKEVVSGTPVDFGSSTDLTQGAPEEQVDMIDEAVWAIMDEVIAYGFSEAQAEKKVNSTMDKLVKDEIIPEIPDYDESDGEKATWIARAIPSVKHQLKMQGDMM